MSARGPGLAVTAWACALLLLACVPTAAAFTSPVVLAPLAGAVLVPFGLVALARRLRVPAWATGTAVVALVLVVAASVARVGAVPLPDGTDDAWRSTGAAAALAPVADAVARLLTAPRPAAPLLALPLVVLAALVALGVALALGRRAPARVAPLVGASVLYAAALLLTAGAADRGVVAVALVAVAAAGWVLLGGDAVAREREAPRLGHASRGPRTRWRAGGVAGLVVVALVAAVGVASAGAVTGRAFEPREHVAPPRVPAPAVHPLAELSRWQTDPDATVLRVAGTHPGHLTWVTLPDFDGTGWSADLDLRAVGTVVEPSLAPGRARSAVDVDVELVALAGPSGSPGTWLPSVGDVVATTAPRALVDADTGVLAVPPTPDGRLPAGLTYRVRGEVDAPDAARAAGAGVPGGAEVERYLRLDRVPPDLRRYAQDVVAGAHSRLDQATLLADTVRVDRELAVDAVSGSSYARLREFLFADRADGGQVGTSEQFAGAFAVLARAVGLPSRVVLGFAVPGGAAQDDAAPRDVRGADVRAWAEVYLAGTGWVRFDPSPDAATATGVAPDARQQDAGTPVEDDVPVDAPQDAPAPDPDADVPPRDAAGGAALGVVALALVVVLGAAGAGTAAVLAALRVVRRRRLRAAGVVGAWQHAAEALALRDGPPPGAATSPRLAERMAVLTGVDASGLARRAEAAAFGPGAETDDAAAWQQAREVERLLRRGARPARRLTWWLAPPPRASRSRVSSGTGRPAR
ncbi:MAG: transglutaminase domain-containing protein [Cellulomonas iranensis]|uniref:transglutaminase-like domain-containing protein n=2 Tax=Cellulomonas iranensis TaxID=76862 RepID=UPI001B18E80A|nr:transglutaminase-like domain-containing protein [Cellulomonas iranensis]MBO9569839.1 transglutaminase domain-containing protein [Cellulomonas iranensis]